MSQNIILLIFFPSAIGNAFLAHTYSNRKQAEFGLWAGQGLSTPALGWKEPSKGAAYNHFCVMYSWHLFPEPKRTLTQQRVGQNLLTKQRASGSLAEKRLIGKIGLESALTLSRQISHLPL